MKRAVHARGSWCLAGVLLGAALGAAWSSTAHAQPAPAEASAGDRAVRLGTQALEAFEAGRFAEAHGRFAEAQSLSPSPVFVLYMARCQRRTGKLLDARARYRQVVAWSVDAAAPEAWSRARADARNELAALEPLVPWLEIEVHGAGGAEVLVDGARAAPGRVEVDPGKHRVTARAGARRQERSVEVAEGDGGRAVVLELGSAPLPPPPPRVVEGSKGPLWPAITAFALGGVGIGVGAVTGVVALDTASAARAECVGNQCPLERKLDLTDDGDRAAGLAHVSTASFIVAGAALAGGVVLLVTRPGGRAAPPVEARLEAGRASLRGYF